MLHRRRTGWTVLLLVLVFGGTGSLHRPLAAAPPTLSAPHALQAAFSAAAHEFHVPEPILLAVAYNLSRWEQHHGAPSVAGGYGPMHLTDVDQTVMFNGRGDDGARLHQLAGQDPNLHTLETAASLLNLSPDVLKHDPLQNIRGGAALLAHYARNPAGTLPVNEAEWYGAVAQYSGSQEAAVALGFADLVYATIQQGVARTTADGQQVTLAAKSIIPAQITADGLPLYRRQGNDLVCPRQLACDFIPAAYQLNNPSDLTDYGNYDLANRPADGLTIRYIVLHNTEISYATTLQIFQNSLSYVSAHYVIRATDGHVTQMVANHNVAWHAGNWYLNGHAIGVEHEGVAIEGATWYTETMYRASATLVRHLAQKYDIPLDRAHILGHDEIPGPTPALQANLHWDPGPFWDWAHYMDLLGAPFAEHAADTPDNIVTINPPFTTNTPALTYCYDAEVADCRVVPPQPANFVYLRSLPTFTAPFVTNPYITAEPTHANNWANKAVTGQQFYRVDRVGDWDALYFSGQLAWLYNPDQHYTVSGQGTVVTPRAGLLSIPVYGRAYPEANAYPTAIPVQELVPIYELPAGQLYVVADRLTTSYYWAPEYAPTLETARHTVVQGQEQYYQIFFNHRLAFVKATDVEVISPPKR